MTSTAEEKALLNVAVAAIPRVAEIILGFPPDDQAGALEMAERRFLAAASDYGCTEIAARSRVSVIMRRLRRPHRAGNSRSSGFEASLALRYQSVSFCIETTVSVTACCSNSFSSCLALSSNPTQRNLRMSLTISLDDVGACLATVSIIVLSRVLVLVAPSYFWRHSLQPLLWPRPQHIVAQT
jgi:hypothetical protein